MDYRQFLQDDSAEFRLPYFEGLKVCNDSRSWRLREPVDPGWYRFSEKGRFLEPQEAIEPELDAWLDHKLKRRSGYLALGQFIGDDCQRGLFGVPRDEDPPRFTPVKAVEWFDGHLHFECIDFETEAEFAVREAFEEEHSIDSIKGVTPALANAFLLETTRRELVREAQRRREEQLRRQQREAATRELRREIADRETSLDGRLAVALSHSGAHLIDWRRSGGNLLSVRYRVGGQRFECIIDRDTLQIVDAGICLEGTDDQLNLASLPSAVQEAIDSGQLYVFRRG